MAGGLDDYRKKRDFARTPEPAPGLEPPDADGTYVVHRHEARRLHYDLRLAAEGVLKCWAVPKGFSWNPKDKHLAVHTEDHPIEYETFEGMIPKGEYGGGTMTIWDRGHYRVVKAAGLPGAIAAGELKVELFGRRLRGEWHLVRTKQDWLLFKARDRHAAADGIPALDFDLTAARAAAVPTRLQPMQPSGERAPFSDPGWLFEIDFDGARVLVRKRGDTVAFVGHRSIAARLPQVVEAVRRIRAGDAILDGVIVAMDGQGRPSRPLLERVVAGDAEAEIQLYAFDLLHFDAWDLRPLPLHERKRALRAVLPRDPVLLPVEPVVGRGDDLAAAVAAAGLSGMIAKRGASRYAAGASPEWQRCPVHASASARDVDVEQALHDAQARGDRAPPKIAFSNLDKVYWPQTGTTKGDLLTYYQQVADVLLPYLRERPVHLYRWPDGIEGKSFYQQNAPDGTPSWVHTERIERGHKEEPVQQIVCNDRDTLLWLVNLGSIDLHPWMSRLSSLDSPDYAVIDLDPKSAPFSDVVRIAKEVGRLLRGIGLRPLLKTSGASGLHIHVPLQPGYSYEQARMFCEGVARLVVRDLPDIATVERTLGQRRGRVYVDFGQNRRGATIVPPYVVRPVPGATVSTPLHWDELAGELHPSLFDLHNVPERLSRFGDLFRPLLEDRQDLRPAITALEKLLVR